MKKFLENHLFTPFCKINVDDRGCRNILANNILIIYKSQQFCYIGFTQDSFHSKEKSPLAEKIFFVEKTKKTQLRKRMTT